MRNLMICALLLMGFSSGEMAQSEAKAKSILAEVSKKYRSYDVIKTNFTYTLENPQAKLKETQSGTLTARSKTKQYKIVLKGQELISDGKNQWVHLKADQEAQLSEVDQSSDAMNPSQIFTMYEKGFKMVYFNDTNVN